MKSTKFLLCLLGTVGLLGTAIAGKFTGELGMWVATIVCAYAGANAVITRAALQNGKETPA
jgi:hypothetical protein